MRLESGTAKKSIAWIHAFGERESPASVAGDGSSAVATELQEVPGAGSPRGSSPRVTNTSAALTAGTRTRYENEIELKLDFSGESDKEPDSHATPPASG